MGSPPDPTNLPPGTFIHAWRVVAKLGQGGYGVVYRVELNGQPFALKVAQHRAESGDTARTDDRIRRELSCLSMVHHRHIVHVWAHGRWPDPREGFFYIVEDYVEGYTLAEWAQRTHPTFRQVIELLDPVTDALQAAHERGVFHRDLKPSNILVAQRGRAPVITDFSVGAYPLAEELTEGPVPPGTRRYRSPECLKFERQHPHGERYPFQATDELFALGATLYDILTDPLPAERSARQPLNNDTLPPPSPIKQNPRVPPALSDLTMALLAPDPRIRPPSAADLRRMVVELKADPGEAWDALVYPPSDRLVAASAPPKARRRLRWRGGPRAAALTAALLALFLGILFFGARWRDAQPRPAQAEPPPSSQKETNAVNLSRSTPEASPPMTAEHSPETEGRALQVSPSISPGLSLPQCAALITTVAFLQAGCASVQLRPEPGECPDEAVAAMKKLELFERKADHIYVDTKRRKWDVLDVYENGPTTGVFDPETLPIEFEEAHEVPQLDGHLWVSAPGDRVFGRFTRLRLADGTTFPICAELCEPPPLPGILGVQKGGPGPRKDTVLMMDRQFVCYTDHWR